VFEERRGSGFFGQDYRIDGIWEGRVAEKRGAERGEMGEVMCEGV
jgi:hypothetical protein